MSEPVNRRRVAVIGFGATGRAVAAHLRARGDEAVVFDDAPVEGARTTPDAGSLAEELRRSDLVVPSPGVPLSHPVYVEAAKAGVPVWSEVELAVHDAAGRLPRLLAVTGTNGKTTVTTLVAAILEVAGHRAVPAGNIGLPLVDAVTSGAGVVVAEVSSFQLQFTVDFHPEVSCWLNFSADHLDWHPTLEHYRAAKARIWANQGPGDTAVFNADDPAVVSAASAIPGGVTRWGFSISKTADFCLEDGWLVGHGTRIVQADRLPRAFPHDVSNALAAAAVAVAAGAPEEACDEALASIGPLPHRVSYVGEGHGVAWYDDSKATTPASVLAAVKGFASVVLIAGGRNKGLDLGPLAATVPPVRFVVAIGEAAQEVAAAFGDRVSVREATSMRQAVDEAAEVARPGDAVLLSPGCASFDWYTSYAARGEDFTRVVTAKLAGGDT